jgi:sugar phosphate isomerase/epimerase
MKTVTIPGKNRRQFMVRAASALAGLSFGAPSMLNAIGSSSGYSSREVAATPAAEALTSGEMKNPVCIFSKHLQWLDFDDMGAFLGDLGYGGVDLTVRRGGHVAPDAVPALLPKAVRTLRKYGVEVPMMATNINDPDDPLTEEILRVASGEGIRFYRMQYYKYPKEKNILEALEGFRTKMHRLAELNAKYNIHGAYQNHSGNYVGASVWDAWYMLRGLDPRYSGMQFDIRHAVVEGGYSWNVDMQLVRDFIRCTAVKDFIWQKSNGAYKVKNVPL